jgi:hypothetical protein
MADAEGFDSVSEMFRKYLVKFIMDTNEYYTIWFTDMSTSDQQDKMFISASGELLLFSDIGKVKNYIRSALPDLPDATNFEGWVKNYELDSAYAVYDFDDLQRSISEFGSVSALRREDALDQLDCFNLIGDYRDLVNDQFLEEKMRSPIMSEFFDLAYVFHFWKTPEGTIDPGIDPVEFKETFGEIVRYFFSRIKIL